MSMTFLSNSEEETEALGYRLGQVAEPGDILLLDGDLGVGKTCFARGLARGLGVSGDTPVTSPSYTLLNQYQGRLPLHHFDLYRLGDVEELREIGFEDCLFGDGVTLVEWVQRFPELELEGVLVKMTSAAGPFQRHIQLSALGKQARDWLTRSRLQEEAS